jgi:hypothetical protein
MFRYTIAAIIGAIALLLFANIQGAWSQEVLDLSKIPACVTSEFNQTFLTDLANKNNQHVEVILTVTGPAIQDIRDALTALAQRPVIEFDKLEIWTTTVFPDQYFVISYDKNGCENHNELVDRDVWKEIMRSSGHEMREASN